LTCSHFTWILMGFADYVVLGLHDLTSVGDLFMMLLFNGALGTALYCHLKAVTTEPGCVPLRDPSLPPVMWIDRHRPEWVDGELVTTCSKCKTYKPQFAHHCSTCGRCVRRMDHHCPWVNNCVGENNQKHFIRFTLYIFFTCFLAGVAVTRKVIQCSASDWSDDCTMTDSAAPLKIILVGMEIMVFGLFTLIMFCDQMCGVVNNVDKIGGWQKGEGSGNDADVEASSSSSSSKMENIRRVFGDDVSALSWILPVPAGSVGALRKRGARHNQGIMSV